MNRPLKVFWFRGTPVRYRPWTNDLKIIKEVLETGVYRRPRSDIDVEEGETWLDLGAHIGSFACYCKSRGAVAVCYEPDLDCFRILQRNVSEFECYNSAVTVYKVKTIKSWVSKKESNHSRLTTIDQTENRMALAGDTVTNTHIDALLDRQFDGIKIDIEGAEMGIIDSGKLPTCNKFCFEYHLSRDCCVVNLRRRLAKLKTIFNYVGYRPSLDKITQAQAKKMQNLDRVIYCKGRKNPQ